MPSNDEVERRGASPASNESTLSHSSTYTLLTEDAPRDRSNRLLEVSRLNTQTSPGKIPTNFTASNRVMILVWVLYVWKYASTAGSGSIAYSEIVIPNANKTPTRLNRRAMI